MKMSFLFLSVIISLQVAANENLVNNLPLKPTPSSMDIGEYGYTPMPGPDGRYVGIVLFESVDKEGNYIGDKKVPGRGKMLLHLKTDPTQAKRSTGEAMITPDHKIDSIVKAVDRMRDEQGCAGSFEKRGEETWLSLSCPHDVGVYGQN
jgi:hypothetical protein